MIECYNGRCHTYMNSAHMASLVPNPEDLLKLTRDQQGKLLLELLAQQHTGPQTAESHANFFTRANDYLNPPKYGHRQPEVDEALRDAWTWAESQGLLTKSPSSAGNWVYVGKSGKDFLRREACIERWEKLGYDRVKSDLENNEGRRTRGVGSGPEELDWAWEWVHEKEDKPPLRPATAGAWPLIAESRLAELRALTSSQFDFRKLIRLCEELNTAYQQECYFATAMLTRALLDHVPPIFDKKNFDEVASNYGGKSFKGTMHHLQNASRNVADGHLHQQVRKAETLPTAQQVNCGQQLDALLEEIIRITREKGLTP